MADWAVILAGGSGTRLWPRTRHDRPKPLLKRGDRTLLEQTLRRLPIPPERVVVVTDGRMAEAVRAAVPQVPAEQVLVEPSPRHTAPAAAWATWWAAKRGASRVAVLPSDQGIGDEPAFRAALSRALSAADEQIVLLGIAPDRPETGFGWILASPEAPPATVMGFVEKPPRAEAEVLMARGGLWNAGIFCWRPERLRATLRDTLPGLARALSALDEGATVEAVWQEAEAISVDRGLLEPLAKRGGVAVIPARCGWSDLGTHEALLQGEADAAAVWAVDGGGHVVYSPKKLVLTVGLEELVIVDTDDALLICRREDAQRLGPIVGELDARGLGRFR